VLANIGNDYYSTFHTFRNNSGVQSLIIDSDNNYFTFGNAAEFSQATLATNGETPMYLVAGSAGGRILLNTNGAVQLEDGGTQVASFSTGTSQIKSDEFNVTMQDNTQLLTVANYGTRINNGSLWIGDTGEDGTIQTSAADDDLTIQSNDGTTGGKIFLQDGIGVKLYAENTEIASFTTSTGLRVYDAYNLPTAAPASNGEYLEGAADGTTVWTDRVHAKTIYENAKNVSGGTLTKGTPVYQVGITGNTITVAAARADDPTKLAIGVLDETLADEAEGRMLVLGEIRGVDTLAFSTGDRIYLGAAGGYTNTPPTGTNFIQFLGVVFRVDDTVGSGFITGTLTADATKTEDGVISSWNGTVWTPIQGTASTTGINTTATTTIFTFDPAVYDTAKLTITVKDSGDYHAVEMLVVSDGTDVWSNEYSVVLSGTELATFTATISSGQVVVQAAATAPTDMTIKATASLTAV
jgi:hypothetical protein